MCETYSKLTIKKRCRHRSIVFIVNFELITHIVLLFLFLTLTRKCPVGIKISTKGIAKQPEKILDLFFSIRYFMRINRINRINQLSQ